MNNTILLTFDNNDDNLNFVDAVCNRDGNLSQLRAYSHLGFSTDSMLIYDETEIIDIRYFPTASRDGEFIEFYSFDTDGLAVYLHNTGDKPLAFWTFVGLIDVAPGEQKLVDKASVAPDSRERKDAYKEKIRQQLPRLHNR